MSIKTLASQTSVEKINVSLKSPRPNGYQEAGTFDCTHFGPVTYSGLKFGVELPMNSASSRSGQQGWNSMFPQVAVHELSAAPLSELLAGMPEGTHKGLYSQWLNRLMPRAIPSPFGVPTMLSDCFDSIALINVENFGPDIAFRVLVAGEQVSQRFEAYIPDTVISGFFNFRQHVILRELHAALIKTHWPTVEQYTIPEGVTYTQSAMPIFNSRDELVQMLCGFEF